MERTEGMDVHAPAPDEIITLMASTGSAHLSVSRGALPFVVPTRIRVDGDYLLLLTCHPSVMRGAARGDIAALQVDADIDGIAWSLLATGPLHQAHCATPALRLSATMLTAECLSSAHGDRIDPLLRTGLAGRP